MGSIRHNPSKNMRRQNQRRARGRRLEDMSNDFDAARLLHELRVHQIELETQNREMQQAKAQAEAALASHTNLYDFAPVGYYTLDREGVIRHLNLAGATLLGSERATLIGKRFGQFIEDEDRSGFNAFLERILDERTHDSCEFELTNPRDPQQRLSIQLEAAADAAGQTAQVAALDITEKKRATEALMQTNLELQQLTHIAAQDLQAPLHAIEGFIRQLQAGDESRQAAHEVRRMQTLIRDLLAYSQVVSQASPREPVDLDRLMAECLAASQAHLSEAGATVTYDPLPAVMGNPRQLAELLQYLIDIGISHPRTGEGPRIHVSASRQPGEWQVSVSHNGIGIAAKPQDFDLFHRLRPPDIHPGSAIGLALCRRILQRHGGRIWADADPQGGGAFHFTLPDRPHP